MKKDKQKIYRSPANLVGKKIRAIHDLQLMHFIIPKGTVGKVGTSIKLYGIYSMQGSIICSFKGHKNFMAISSEVKILN